MIILFDHLYQTYETQNQGFSMRIITMITHSVYTTGSLLVIYVILAMQFEGPNCAVLGTVTWKLGTGDQHQVRI